MPPAEPVTASARSPQRSRRTPAPAQQATRKTPKKSTDTALPKRKSKAAAPAAGQQQQKLASKGAADAASGAVDGNVSGGGGGGGDAASATASNTTDDGTPAELSAAIAAWQQFEEQAKALLVGRKQADNMVQLLLSQVEGKRPEQVTIEVFVTLIAFADAGWLSVFLLYRNEFVGLQHCALLQHMRQIAACLLLLSLESCAW